MFRGKRYLIMSWVSHDKKGEDTDQHLPTPVYGSEAGGGTRRLLWVGNPSHSLEEG